MENDEKKLSDYIDRLNEEKKPEVHGNSTESPQMEELMKTVRKVRSLKEPALPGADYPVKLAENVAKQLPKKLTVKKKKHTWIAAAAAVAAVIALVFAVNFILHPGGADIVYAMEQAFQEVKAYHGIIEIIEKNAEGKETTQAIREVWADKEGHYYIKELEGSQAGVITVNNGEKKWQQLPQEKKVYVFPAFPDPYRFTFELGNEIDDVKNAAEVKAIGEDKVLNRSVTVLEVTPKGGLPYRIWVDRETKLPLKRESAMQNAIQYTVTYTSIEYRNALPEELTIYSVPDGFEEVDRNPEQWVNNIEEVEDLTGFAPKIPKELPESYKRDGIAVANGMKTVKLNYTSRDKKHRVIILQEKTEGELNPASAAVLGTLNGNVAEIQSPVQEDYGVLAGGGVYSGVSDISSIRWQEGGFEFAVVGNDSLEHLALFAESLAGGPVVIPKGDEKTPDKPQIEVPVDLEIEENDQKSVDAGHSPWKLDPVYVAQVFVSLKISPEGIQGDYPVQYEDIKVVKNDGVNAVVEVSSDTTPIRRVYLKRLIRQDSTGIWTVVGYDPVSS
ncbi:MAG TPA: sigma-E factor regulatory protein RseB domain-containing protein [Acetivibrio sp.]|mgnify:CR=1 FL=1|jgi:outer membrane lipoprotein-sorting protein|nr:hypothetical protein [Clostridium sp.]HOQ36944.1 sigma-E factor regulatory protein RseB domain-containing protein [Acetivibrio sp.]HPT90944.1 sigma-E factor regulatory protein RseB domain-containing protein [Acetivibrio sp.]HQA57704.1 sigma-E factor regulatory protein RseB domain-containing protein [Acetivibrio sp.]